MMRLTLVLFLISLNALGQDHQTLRFIQNKGQWNKDIDFQALIPGGRVGVSATGFSVMLLDMEEMEHRHLQSHGAVNESTGHLTTDPINGHYFKINLLGANSCARAIPETPLDGHYNYFLGKDTSRWASNARAFSSVLYQDVYDGIDFRVASAGKNLKYDFIVAPGADPSQIKIEYVGTYGIRKTEGDLEISTALGTLTETRPFSYQGNDNNRQTVASEYRLDDNIISFSFPEAYDTSCELVIDPLLIFSTYSGSTADNWGSTATPGEHGTLYSAGVTTQDLGGFFPTTVGAFQTTNKGSFDMAVIKYDSAGTRFLHATYLGGVNNDSPESLVVDTASDDLIVLGISSSPDYPTGPGSFDQTFNLGTTVFNRVLNTEDQWDIVLTRLSADGDQLVGSTFIGGSGNDGLNLPKQSGGPLVVNYGDEMRGDVITDASGYVYISSVTSSVDFPIVGGFDNSFNGATDGLVVKLTPDLSSIVWSSYVGGSDFDAAYSIKFDNDNNIVLAGGTTSADFPATSGVYQSDLKGDVDGWIARVAADGSAVMNATFTGTISFDQVYFIDLNADGEIFCYGQTAGYMPVTAGVYNNPSGGQFLQKFSADLSTLEFSTVFGSVSVNGFVVPNISPTAFLVNDCNNIYMAGWGGFVNASPETGFWQSGTFGMPVTEDAHQKTTSGSDFYFMVLNGDATQLVYATFLGGGDSKTHVDGGTSRFDKYGIVYHAVCSGCAFGNTTAGPTSDFPTTPGARSRLNSSANCNNAAFKFDLSSLNAMFETNSMDLTMPGFNNVCYPDTIVFQNTSTGGRTIVWDFDDGTVVSQDNTDPRMLIHQYQQEGQYHVKLTITDLSTCSQTDFVVKTINYFENRIEVGEGGEICDGTTFRLTATGGSSYVWSSEDNSFSSSSPSPVVQPGGTTRYFLTATDPNGCVLKDTIEVAVLDSVKLEWQHRLHGSCTDRPSVFVQNLTPPQDDVTFRFDFGDGTTSDQTETEHVYEADGLYPLRLIAQKKFCVFEETAQLPVYRLMLPNVFTPETSPGYNDKFEVRFGSDLIAPTEAGLKIELLVVDRWGKTVFESPDYKNDWNGDNLAAGVYYVHMKVGEFATCKEWLHILR